MLDAVTIEKIKNGQLGDMINEIFCELELESYYTGQALRECTIRTDFLFGLADTKTRKYDRVPNSFIDYAVEGSLLFEKKRENGGN